MNGLASKGHEIHIISADKQERYSKYHKIIQSILRPNVIWYSTKYSKNPPILSTYRDLIRIKSVAEKIIRENNISILHIRSYPPMSLALKLKRKYGLKLLFDMRGFYADERIEGNIWNMKNPIHRFAYYRIKKLEKRYFGESDHLVSLTYTAKDYLNKEFGLDKGKVTVIPCCADFEHFTLKKYHLSDNLRIVYLGSLGTWYLIPELLTLFKRIQAFHSKAHLLILTSDEGTVLNESIYTLGISKDSITIRSAERTQLPEILSEIDLSIFLIKESFSKIASSPTKLAELLACGVPVLCNSGVGDLSIIAQEHEGVEAHSLKELDTMNIEPLVSKLLSAPPNVIREQAKEEFSLITAIERYDKIYSDLLKD